LGLLVRVGGKVKVRVVVSPWDSMPLRMVWGKPLRSSEPVMR
jgi:hypothetical protein